MVRPHDKADNPNRHHRIRHGQIAKDRLLREGRDDVADNPEPGQDHDVDFRVTKEPEQVLEHNRVAAPFRDKELRSEITVGQEHSQRASKNRQGQ